MEFIHTFNSDNIFEMTATLFLVWAKLNGHFILIFPFLILPAYTLKIAVQIPLEDFY